MNFKLMDEANYNFDAHNQGWIYEWLYKLEMNNADIMTIELLNEILTESPSLDAFENPVPNAQNEKANLEERTKSLIKSKNLGGMSK